jgi:hypothetical protein
MVRHLFVANNGPRFFVYNSLLTETKYRAARL